MPQSNFSRQRRAAEKALLNAAEQGKLATLARLVEEGVNVNATHRRGFTALMHAAISGKLDCLEHLIAKGANLNAQNKVRRGPAATWRRGM